MKLEAKFKKQVGNFQLDLAIDAESKTLVLWGPSGAGKTLSLNCLAGFAKPDAGRILVGDRLYFDGATDVHVPPQKRRCGYIFQDHALFPHMTVLQNLRFAASVRRGRSHARIKDLVEAFELGDLTQRKPAALSGGQQQRAALARALIAQPEMLLLDEPTQGLDGRLKSNFFDLLRSTRARSEALMLLVTHDLDECFELADYLCLLQDGKVSQAGQATTVLDSPATVQVAKSFGIYNVAPAEIEALDPGRNSSRIRMLGQSWIGKYFRGHLIGDRGFAAFKQTAIAIAPKSENNLQVSALKHFSSGVRLELEGGLTAVVGETQLSQVTPGSSLPVRIDPDKLLFLAK